MPDLGTTFARIRTLESMVVRPMPKGVEDVLLVGVDQRTPQRAGFNGEGRTAVLKVQTTWAGDGTVIRDSAVLERMPLHPTSFADHQRILHDPQIQAFLRVALIKGVDQALASVPVRPRGKVRAADGSLTELVGVVVEPDEPIYKTGDICKVRVHLRLGDITKFDPASIRLTRRMMDGREVPIAAVARSGLVRSDQSVRAILRRHLRGRRDPRQGHAEGGVADRRQQAAGGRAAGAGDRALRFCIKDFGSSRG